jgi:peptide/nickel transport system substrate-binding protein
MPGTYWPQGRLTRRESIRRFGMAAGALALLQALAACKSSRSTPSGASATGASHPVRGGTLTSSMNSDINTLDYAFATDFYSNAMIANCVEALLTVDTQGQPTGLLATSWENPDDHTYLFKLRQGVTFQDGTPFNADAVEYSLNRIRANKASNQYSQLVYIDKIEKPDPATVKLTLSSPYAPLLYNLAGNAGRLISPDIGEKYGNDRLKVDLTGRGTGPFTFFEWKSGDHVTLVRNETYWGKDAFGTQLPYADKLVYRVIQDPNQALASLRSGEIDAYQLAIGIGSPPSQAIAGLRADPSLRYSEVPAAGVVNLFFNEVKPPFGSREVRQAIAFAIDRAAINHAVWFDTAQMTDVIFTPAVWVYEDAYHPYLKRDVARAKQLLAQAGHPSGLDFELLTRSDSPAWQQAAELMKDQLGEAGMTVTIRLAENTAVNAALKAGQHQVAYQGSNPGLDPDGWVYPYFSSKGALNSDTRYANAEVDSLLERARTTLDTATRKTLYQQAQRLILDDAAVCPVFDNNTPALSRANVHNVPLGPTPAVGASQVWKSG